MNRRQSLLALSTVSGHALFPEVVARFGRVLAAPAEAAGNPRCLSVEQGELLAELVETIIPATDTPGARAARVHVFVDLVLAALPDGERAGGLREGSGRRSRRSAHPVRVRVSGRSRGLARRAAAASRRVRGSVRGRTLKELTVLGYCTSEIGATQALAYEAVPGDYRGCVDLKPGQKGWAT